MDEERRPDNRIWWVVGLVLVLLLALCLCTSCLLVAGTVSFFSTTSRTTSYSYSELVPESAVTVPAMPLPIPEQEGPDYRMRTGAHILSIAPGSPAEGVGWEPGDIITMVDGRALGSNYDLRQALSDKRPGDMVSVEWWSRRTRETQGVRLQLGRHPDRTDDVYLGIEYRMQP